jgi:hypothetical protein
MEVSDQVLELLKRLMEILAGTSKNPVGVTIALIVAALLAALTREVFRKIIRDQRISKAAKEKNKDKAKNIDVLENKHAEASIKLRDRLKGLGNEEED